MADFGIQGLFDGIPHPIQIRHLTDFFGS